MGGAVLKQMGKKRRIGLVLATATACASGQIGSAAPTDPETPPAIEVAPPPPSSEDERESLATEQTEPPGLAACVDGLRSGTGVDRGAEGRELYDAAYGQERARDYTGARKSYFEVIQRTPSSPLVPLAYLAFGEMFAKDAETDPAKWSLAQAAFQETLKYPAPHNPGYGYAQLRMGDVNLALGRPPEALSSFLNALKAARVHPEAPCAAAIAARASQRLVEAYALSGRPDKASSFFKAATGGNDGTALEMLAELAAAYFERGAEQDGCETLKAATATRAARGSSASQEPLDARLTTLARRCKP